MSETTEDLKKEVEELRAYKAKWDQAYPGLTPEAVKRMEQQLYSLYTEKDNAGDSLATDYQKDLDKSTHQ